MLGRTCYSMGPVFHLCWLDGAWCSDKPQQPFLFLLSVNSPLSKSDTYKMVVLGKGRHQRRGWDDLNYRHRNCMVSPDSRSHRDMCNMLVRTCRNIGPLSHLRYGCVAYCSANHHRQVCIQLQADTCIVTRHNGLTGVVLAFVFLQRHSMPEEGLLRGHRSNRGSHSLRTHDLRRVQVLHRRRGRIRLRTLLRARWRAGWRHSLCLSPLAWTCLYHFRLPLRVPPVSLHECVATSCLLLHLIGPHVSVLPVSLQECVATSCRLLQPGVWKECHLVHGSHGLFHIVL